MYRGADKSLARSGRKQSRKNIRDARDFNNIETRTVIKFFGRAKDLSAPLYYSSILSYYSHDSWHELGKTCKNSGW